MRELLLGLSSKFSTILLAFFAPINTVLVAMGVLIAIDFLTGLWASCKLANKPFWKVIKSSGLRRTAIKGTSYFLTIIVSHILETYFMSWLPAVAIAAGYLAITEVASNFENLAVITGNNVFIKIFNIIKTYFNKKDIFSENIMPRKEYDKETKLKEEQKKDED